MIMEVTFECEGRVIATGNMLALPDKGEIINYTGENPATFRVKYREFTMENGKPFRVKLVVERIPESSESGSTESSSTEKGDTDE